MLLVVVTKGMFIEIRAFGATFSNQVWSIVWLARVWPSVRFSLGVIRWTIEGKYPSAFEKWCVINVGCGLNCLLVSDASSKARSRPRMVTVKAAIFRGVGIVITWVFRGRMLEVISSPAMMLPQARRLIGLITVGLFSLIGGRGLNRGWPIDTKKITRML